VEDGLLAQLRRHLAAMSEVATAKAVQTTGGLTALGESVIRCETPKTFASERLLILRRGHPDH
jgi:hypothetical protein